MTEKKHKNSLSLVHSIKEELKNDKLALISTFFLVAVFLIVYIYSMFLKQSNYVDVNIMDQYLAPLTNGHLLGTDNGGRDIIMMLMISARNSFNIAFAVTLITLVVGNILGVITGYFGGRFDLIFMRFTDFVMILPSMIISIFSWIGTTRLIRARTMTEVNRDYVRASKTSGTSDFKIMFREIWPNLSTLVIAEATLVFAGNIGLETGLSFLGFGLPAGTPSLGTMINEATNPETMTDKPWTWVPATVVILIVVLAIIFIGNALRRVADQRQATR